MNAGEKRDLVSPSAGSDKVADNSGVSEHNEMLKRIAARRKSAAAGYVNARGSGMRASEEVVRRARAKQPTVAEKKEMSRISTGAASRNTYLRPDRKPSQVGCYTFEMQAVSTLNHIRAKQVQGGSNGQVVAVCAGGLYLGLFWNR